MSVYTLLHEGSKHIPHTGLYVGHWFPDTVNVEVTLGEQPDQYRYEEYGCCYTNPHIQVEWPINPSEINKTVMVGM